MSFCIETEQPEKPAVEDINTEDCVGIDLGVLNFVHDSDGRSITRIDLSDDRERLEREQWHLTRKEHGSNNWERQRQRVAEVHARMSNKKRDFKHKFAHFYTTEYDAVFVEDLNVKGMLESPQNARNKAEVGWRDFITILEHHGDKNACHVVEVAPEDTSKECARCGVETDKPLWVREHSCPSCGFEIDRDWNASLNVLHQGLQKLGVVHSEATSPEIEDFWCANESRSDSLTPVETATTVDALEVSARRVVETGSPCLKEPAK